MSRAPKPKRSRAQSRLWAVIMAGGSGTRFWPESRKKNPKQFLRFFGKKTLLEETFHRLRPLIPASRTLVMTQREYLAAVSRLVKIPKSQMIGEPAGRNTAPCTAIAAALMLKKDPDAVLALLPADHHIGKPERFRKALSAAAQLADKSRMPVTFGIQPNRPHTGYGYLELGRPETHQHGLTAYRLKRFWEKPNEGAARHFVKSGKFLWNSGIFVWRADDLLAAVRRYQPAIACEVSKILSGKLDRGMTRFYPRMPNVSIDYGLMEHLQNGILTLPVDMEWSDLGGWQSLGSAAEKDGARNVLKGKTIVIESGNNIVKSDRRLVAMVGVSNLVVVDTEDALLVCSGDKTEAVREVVRQLEKKKLKQYL